MKLSYEDKVQIYELRKQGQTFNQLRIDFKNEHSFYVAQVEQKDKQIAELLETTTKKLQLIGALTIKNEALLLESWLQRLFSGKKDK